MDSKKYIGMDVHKESISDPSRRASNLAGRSNGEPISPEIEPCLKRMAG
jgi:hypothetical protein